MKGRWWKTKSVTAAMKMNQGMLVNFNATPTHIAADGAERSIFSGQSKVKMYFRLHKCGDSPHKLCAHYRYCLPHSIKQPCDLWCAICSYDSMKWEHAGLTVLPIAEQQFITCFLHAMAADTQYCRQVVPDWWSWPVDFWKYDSDVYIQIDGHVHWHGMHNRSSSHVQKLDMAFNAAAYRHRARLVRVHSNDVGNLTQLATAIHAAQSGYSIVLTATYATQSISPGYKRMAYITTLQEKLGVTDVEISSSGNILIR